MSVRIPLNEIGMSERTLITKKLRFNKKETEYNKFKPASTIYAYDIDDDAAAHDDEVGSGDGPSDGPSDTDNHQNKKV